MKTEIYEKSVLVKLFHNKGLQDKYLEDILPGIFQSVIRRVLIFTMQKLLDNNMDISIENIILVQNTKPLGLYLRKVKASPLTEDQVYNEVLDTSVDASPDLFRESFECLHDEAFAYYVESVNKELTYELAFCNRPAILARTKSVDRIHSLLYKSKNKERDDQIFSTMDEINRSSAYLRMASNRLTSILGGWSRGYAGSAIGRPSHNKSTYFTWDSTWQIKHNKLDRVDVISTEESPLSFWRRIFAIELGISIKDMIEGIRKISITDMQKIKDLYEGKIVFKQLKKFSDIIDYLNSLRSEYIWIDHINSISYPQNNDYKGIISLINYEKEWLIKNKDSVIINLSQVNTKEMKKRNRTFPSKEDAYMSSVLEHASREFLSFYYPYKDTIDKDFQKKFAGRGKIPTPDQMQISIEKNSYGDIGIIDMKYIPEFGIFEDVKTSRIGMNVIVGDEPELNLK